QIGTHVAPPSTEYCAWKNWMVSPSPVVVLAATRMLTGLPVITDFGAVIVALRVLAIAGMPARRNINAVNQTEERKPQPVAGPRFARTGNGEDVIAEIVPRVSFCGNPKNIFRVPGKVTGNFPARRLPEAICGQSHTGISQNARLLSAGSTPF